MKINKQYNKKKLVIILILLLVLVTGGYLGVAALNKLPPFAAAEKTYKPGEQVTNLERSESEKKAEETLKDNPEQKTANNQTDTPEPPKVSSAGKLNVNVLLTNAGISNGTVTASGFVTNIVEEGGTCTFKFINGSNVVTKTSTTLTNPTSTTCSTVRFPATELMAGGTWKVSLAYSSEKASGSSNEKEITK